MKRLVLLEYILKNEERFSKNSLDALSIEIGMDNEISSYYKNITIKSESDEKEIIATLDKRLKAAGEIEDDQPAKPSFSGIEIKKGKNVDENKFDAFMLEISQVFDENPKFDSVTLDSTTIYGEDVTNISRVGHFDINVDSSKNEILSILNQRYVPQK